MVKGELKSLRITLKGAESGVLGYVYFQEIAPGKVAKTVEVEPGRVMADYDSEGHLLGVEFLSAEQADGKLMRTVAHKPGAPELGGIDLAEMCKAPT